MTSRVAYEEIAPHRGHEMRAEVADYAANIVCDDCGEVVVSAIRSDGSNSEKEEK